MYPEQYVLLQAVPAAERDAKLDEKALAAPALCLHGKTRKQIVDDLLRGLQEQLRYKKYAEIYKETHDQLQAFLRPFFKSEQDVQEILTDVYIAMLSGQCKKEHLFRLAKQRAINRQQHLAVEGQIFESIDCGLAGVHADLGETGLSDAEMPPSEFRSPHADDQDPLDILLRREELQEGVRKVLTNRKYRGVRSRGWWKDFVVFTDSGSTVPEMAG